MTASTISPVRVGRPGVLPLPVPALAFAVLTLASIVLSLRTPWPGTAAAEVLAYQQEHTAVIRVAAFLQFGASIPLAILAAALYQRLLALGIRAPGSAIAFAGGLLAAGATALLGVFGLASAEVAPMGDTAVAGTLSALSFAVGSVGYVPVLALLVAGVAVPGLLTGILPRLLSVVGLVIAAVGMLSTATVLTPVLDPALPIGRFGGVLWLVAASVLLPARRPARS